MNWTVFSSGESAIKHVQAYYLALYEYDCIWMNYGTAAYTMIDYSGMPLCVIIS